MMYVVIGAALLGGFTVAVLLLVIRAGRADKPESQPAAGAAGRCPDSSCGAENDPGAKFCRHCGKPLSGQ